MQPEVYDDFIKLNESLCQFASVMLQKQGEFYPFAAAIKADGVLTHIGGDIGTERPNAAELARFLEDALTQGLADGRFRSFGLCINAAVFPPNETVKTDALFIPFVHSSGDALHYFVPYDAHAGTVTFKKGFFRKPQS